MGTVKKSAWKNTPHPLGTLVQMDVIGLNPLWQNYTDVSIVWLFLREIMETWSNVGNQTVLIGLGGITDLYFFFFFKLQTHLFMKPQA